MSFEAVIGLEIHVELKTETKLFCSCKNTFAGSPNSRICPVCTGQPGALPSTNKKAVELAVLAAILLRCEVANKSAQCRKHYFYPDLPKGYQTSQREHPIGKNGSFEYFSGGEVKKIEIEQVHLEEDAGKLVHMENGKTGVDFNRAGVPLIEIVTRPGFHSAGEVRDFLETLRRAVIRAGISECRMEQGQLRCDVNVSTRKAGDLSLNQRVEMKNINSFSGAFRAVEYEIARQIQLRNSGKEIAAETRRWDDEKKNSFVMRSKESVPDYKFMPDPDIPTYVIPEIFVEKLRKELPETELSCRARYKELNVSDNDTEIILSDVEMSAFFDACCDAGTEASECAKLLVGEVSSILSKKSLSISESLMSPDELCKVSELCLEGKINRQSAKAVIEKLILNGGSAVEYAREYEVISDTALLLQTVSDVISKNTAAFSDYKKGKTEALAYLTGQCMRILHGRADAVCIKKIIKEKMEERI